MLSLVLFVLGVVAGIILTLEAHRADEALDAEALKVKTEVEAEIKKVV